MVETKTTFETTTKLEFNLEAGTTKFSVRQATLQVLQQMKSIDKTMTITSVLDDTQWSDPTTIPKDPTQFGQHFNVREESPPRGSKKIVIHFKLQTTNRFGDIKYNPVFFNYLKQQRIYIKVDKFGMKQMATPGFLIDIHPHLTSLTALHEELTDKMAKTKVKDTTVIDEWNEANPEATKTYSTSLERICAEMRGHTIPKFNIHSGKRSFGTDASRVETVCLIIECAATDAKYLKALLSSVYVNQEYKRGMFVPSGMHLMESPQVLCNLLRRHNKYLKTTSAVPIFGLNEDALQTNIILENGDELDMEDFISQYVPEIESIERTNKTKANGKWFLVCRQTKTQHVYNFVDETLPDMYKRFVAADDLHPGFACPTRIPPQTTTTRNKAPPKIVGSYAAVLRAYSVNPQEDDNTADNNTEFNKAPERPRKRQAVQLTFDNNEFPLIPGTNTSATQATPSTVTQLVPTQTNDFEQKLIDIEKRLQQQITTIHENQVSQMTQVLSQFDAGLRDMANNMNLMMVNVSKL